MHVAIINTDGWYREKTAAWEFKTRHDNIKKTPRKCKTQSIICQFFSNTFELCLSVRSAVLHAVGIHVACVKWKQSQKKTKRRKNKDEEEDDKNVVPHVVCERTIKHNISVALLC